MSQLKEILQIETERGTFEQRSVIHLFREGTFYRAYEWSAWLCVRHFTELKVTHRLLKGGEDIVFVGFPLTSLDRYTPQGAEVSPSGENGVDIMLPGNSFPVDADGEALQADFANWKQSQPLTEASKKKVAEEKIVAERNAPPAPHRRDAENTRLPHRATLAHGMHGVSWRHQTTNLRNHLNTTTEHIRVSSQAVGPRENTARDNTDGVVGLQGHSLGLENKQTADANLRRRLFLPAAGNRWDSELNNAGSNGNYWSRSLNTDNPNNAWNLNFNSDDCNMNNNNRNNGFTVRPVRQHFPEKSVCSLTRERLLANLRQAYYDARRHKRNKPYQLRFEANLEHNLGRLCDELFSRTYKPLPSTCFIITEPKKREVFAAHFRDRIVHHLYYNYTHLLFERTSITDNYSCIKGRGTHFGVNRLEQHIRKESQNFTVPCYVMKMDIRGYFMHIDRTKLLEICLATLGKMATHCVSRLRPETWQERIDVEFVKYLTEVIVMQNPIDNCRMGGNLSDWNNYNLRKNLLTKCRDFSSVGMFNHSFTKFNAWLYQTPWPPQRLKDATTLNRRSATYGNTSRRPTAAPQQAEPYSGQSGRPQAGQQLTTSNYHFTD